jgi:hypothetical protein
MRAPERNSSQPTSGARTAFEMGSSLLDLRSQTYESNSAEKRGGSARFGSSKPFRALRCARKAPENRNRARSDGRHQLALTLAMRAPRGERAPGPAPSRRLLVVQRERRRPAHSLLHRCRRRLSDTYLASRCREPRPQRMPASPRLPSRARRRSRLRRGARPRESTVANRPELDPCAGSMRGTSGKGHSRTYRMRSCSPSPSGSDAALATGCRRSSSAGAVKRPVGRLRPTSPPSPAPSARPRIGSGSRCPCTTRWNERGSPPVVKGHGSPQPAQCPTYDERRTLVMTT